jgi:ribosome-associated protein
MKTFVLKDEHIKLGQLLKAAGLVGSGVDAKFVIQNGEVTLNGEVCTMRGKKIFRGDEVTYDNETVKVV